MRITIDTGEQQAVVQQVTAPEAAAGAAIDAGGPSAELTALVSAETTAFAPPGAPGAGEAIDAGPPPQELVEAIAAASVAGMQPEMIAGDVDAGAAPAAEA